MESGVPFSWVAGDEVYGSDRNLRLWLERQVVPHVLAIKQVVPHVLAIKQVVPHVLAIKQVVPHVLAIKRNEKLWALTDRGPRQVRADRLASQVDESGWSRCSAGDGSKGPRVYDWTTVDIRPLREPGRGYWLLARRSLANPGELSYYVCYGPAGTTLEELVRVAGTRWSIEESFEEAKGQVALDQYEVRRWDGWYRHITLAMLAQAYLSVVRHQAMEQGEKGATTVRDEELIPLTVPEVRRLLTRLVWTESHPPDFVLYWSRWRRRHQARARMCHYKRRMSYLRL